MKNNGVDLAQHLRSTKPPWAAVLCLDDVWRTLNRVLSNIPDLSVTPITGDRCRTKSTLLTEFANKLKFPSYFGHNWDALDECLRDLSWLPCSGYVILITDAEELLRANEDDYATFVDVVSSAGEYWATPRFDGSHRAAAPFHLLLLTSPDRAATRNWRVPRLEVEVGR